MKKILLMAVMAVMCLCAQAQQYETELRGRYFEARTTQGEDWDSPTSIHFKTDGTCTYTDRRGTLECSAYIVSFGGATLHLISSADFDGTARLTILNLRIFGYGRMDHERGTWLHLGHYGSTGRDGRYVEMEFSGLPSAVRAVEAGTADDGTMYNLQGAVIATPKGIYIQGGRKKMQ